MNALYATLLQKLHQYAKENHVQQAVLGLSGGLNSAVALCIAARAFGPRNITALILPELGTTPHEDIDHAKALAQHFGCAWHYQPINNFLVDYHFITWEKSPSTYDALKTRVRSGLIHHCADTLSAMVLGTASKSDLLLGQGVRDGEFTGEIQILGDLYKTDVIELARWIGLPNELLEKPCSRNLHPHQSDEEDLSGAWSKVDEILRELTQGRDPETLIEKGMDPLLIHKIVRLLQQYESTLKDYPILNIGRVPEAIQKAQAAEASTLFE